MSEKKVEKQPEVVRVLGPGAADNAEVREVGTVVEDDVEVVEVEVAEDLTVELVRERGDA